MIYAKNPSFNIREKLNEVTLPAGAAGRKVLAYETLNDLQEGIGLTGHNLYVNGDFNVWQRGESFSGTLGSTTYTADRWKTFSNIASTVTRGSLTTLPDGSKSTPFVMTATAASTNAYLGLHQIVEDWSRYYERELTISAWVKSNNKNINIFVNNGSHRVFHPGDGEWHKLVIRFVSTYDGGSNNTSGTTIGIIGYATGSTDNVEIGDYVQVAQMKLEFGGVATPYQREDKGLELLRCQRYYWKLSAISSFAGFGYAIGANTQAYCAVLQPTVPMRRPADATLSWQDLRLTYQFSSPNLTPNTVVLDYMAQGTFQITFNLSSGGVTGEARLFGDNGSGNGYIAIDNEL